MRQCIGVGIMGGKQRTSLFIIKSVQEEEREKAKKQKQGIKRTT